jgi:sulfide dehydrogenase cytochrome subunit
MKSEVAGRLQEQDLEETMHRGISAWLLFWVAAPALAVGNIEVLARTCNNCHGLNGVSVGTTMPSIGGLPKVYLANILKEWKYDKRGAITMNRIVKGLSDDEIDALAAYFAKLPWVPVSQPTSAENLAIGKTVINENCEDCHGATGSDPDVGAPKLNGQWARYMGLELEKYRDPEFRMTHRKMRKAARGLEEAEVHPVAEYYGAQDR